MKVSKCGERPSNEVTIKFLHILVADALNNNLSSKRQEYAHER